MSEENLSDLLERTADRHKVGTPPLDQMLARSRRARKRRAGFMALAASVVVGSVIVGTTWLFDPSDSAGPADSPADGMINLEGQWSVMLLADGDDGGLTPPGPLRGGGGVVLAAALNVAFENGNVTIDSRVNCHYEAQYSQAGERGTDLRFRSDSGFTVDLGMTCLAAKSLYAVMPSVRHVSESDGALTLLAEDGKRVAVLKRVSTESIDLEGEWKVTALLDADGHSIFGGPEAQTKSISFEDGKLRGRAGCGAISGTYTLTGDNDRDLELTYRWVSEGLCPDEPPLYARLRDVRHVSEAGGKLQLHAENWMIIAVLQRESVEPDPSQGTLSESEFSTAVQVAKDQQAKVTGTFVGATAFASNDTRTNACPGGRNLHIRLVWDKDAGFDYSAPYGVTVTEGPRKALLLVADAKTGSVCEIGTKVQDVGASPNETLLYGQWPDPKDS